MTQAHTINRNRDMRKAMAEKMWAEGRPAEEIAAAMGWSSRTPPQTQIAIYRKRGYNFPHRQDPEITRAQKEARWPTK